MQVSLDAIPPNPNAASRTALLRDKSVAFCRAFLSPPEPSTLVSEYFTSNNPRITEHGPSWASSRLPFLGKTFSGVSSCVDYFNVLSSILKLELSEESFPGPEGFVVDQEANKVAVRATGRFESLKTGKGWDEQFAYVLSDFDKDGKIGHWEIWADPLSAWDAVGGD